MPLISTLLTHIGWDRTGRYCRRLRPMWADLTAAVPEIVLEMRRDHNGRTDPAIRLHRMTVEIRDSLLHLERYSDSPDDLAATGGDPHIHGRRIAETIATKAAGHPRARAGARPDTKSNRGHATSPRSCASYSHLPRHGHTSAA
ncbi:DUF6545 domain-containing protein [Nocardia sp. CA-107356]|uniref:DUF6545 domain-containing protein n=1 Tax=Nocardia sp. CA-107356 TaxID=3239972 RepID=UPI003D8E2D31